MNPDGTDTTTTLDWDRALRVVKETLPLMRCSKSIVDRKIAAARVLARYNIDAVYAVEAMEIFKQRQVGCV
jgi:hypothetical protein